MECQNLSLESGSGGFGGVLVGLNKSQNMSLERGGLRGLEGLGLGLNQSQILVTKRGLEGLGGMGWSE